MELRSTSEQFKKQFKSVKIDKAFQFEMPQNEASETTKKNVGLLIIPYVVYKNHFNEIGEFQNKLTEKKGMYFFSIAKRTMIHNRVAHTQRIPISRT